MRRKHRPAKRLTRTQKRRVQRAKLDPTFPGNPYLPYQVYSHLLPKHPRKKFNSPDFWEPKLGLESSLDEFELNLAPTYYPVLDDLDLPYAEIIRDRAREPKFKPLKSQV